MIERSLGGEWPGALHRSLGEAPVPEALSREAQELWRRGLPTPEAAAADLAEQREICARIQAEIGNRQSARYGVSVDETTIGGVPVRIFRPENPADRLEGAILVNCHGGGFMKDSGSTTENIPIAALSGHTVVAILYRLAPENAFPAAVDDVEAVFRHLVARHPADRIGLYGTSAGAILCAQALVRFRSVGLPLPARLGFFTGSADLTRMGDSEWFFPLADDPRPVAEILQPYLDCAPGETAAVSPLLGDLRSFPATLCISGTRDLMLSQTCIFHRALLRADVDARLVVFEAMPHAHWSYLELPETDEAFSIMARFLRFV